MRPTVTPALWPLLLITWVAVPAPATAQMLSLDYGLMGAPLSNFLSTSYLTQSVVNDLSRPGRAAAELQAYEQMAIIGMLMAGRQMGLKQQPDAAFQERMQGADADYLRQFLGTNPERLEFTPRGITLR